MNKTIALASLLAAIAAAAVAPAFAAPVAPQTVATDDKEAAPAEEEGHEHGDKAEEEKSH